MSEDALEYIALQWASRIHDRPLPDKLEGVYDAEHRDHSQRQALACPAPVRAGA